MRAAAARAAVRDESGIALVAAIVVLSVMFTMTVAMLSYTAATGRDASLQHARQRATDPASSQHLHCLCAELVQWHDRVATVAVDVGCVHG